MTTAEEFAPPSDEFHLACLVLSPSGGVYLDEALAEVAPADFGDPTYGWIWAAARVLHDRREPISRRSIAALRDAVAPRKQVGEARAPLGQAIPGLPFNAPSANVLEARLAQLVGEPFFSGRLSVSIRSVREAGRMRRLIEAVDSARSSILNSSDYSTALELLHSTIGQIDNPDGPASTVRFDTLVREFHEWQAADPRLDQIIPTPWPEINQLFNGGFRSGQLIIIAGRPGSGKSNAGLGVATNAAESGYPSLVISQEMSNLELTGRVMASGARVEYSQITRRAMDDYTSDAVQRYGEEYRDMPLWMLDEPGITVEYAATVAKSMKRMHDLALMELDYVQLLDATDTRVSRQQQVSHISRKLKLLARELGIVVIMLSQLNRENVRDGRKPGLADLRESGSLEQDADGVILLHHEEVDGRPSGYVKGLVPKNRSGPIGEVDLRWHGHQARIGD